MKLSEIYEALCALEMGDLPYANTDAEKIKVLREAREELIKIIYAATRAADFFARESRSLQELVALAKKGRS